MAAVKQFAKDIGAPDAIICDMAQENVSADIKMFLNDIGMTLHALEEGTPWVNKAKLYIKLITPLFSSGTTVLRGEFGFIT